MYNYTLHICLKSNLTKVFFDCYVLYFCYFCCRTCLLYIVIIWEDYCLKNYAFSCYMWSKITAISVCLWFFVKLNYLLMTTKTGTKMKHKRFCLEFFVVGLNSETVVKSTKMSRDKENTSRVYIFLCWKNVLSSWWEDCCLLKQCRVDW